MKLKEGCRFRVRDMTALAWVTQQLLALCRSVLGVLSEAERRGVGGAGRRVPRGLQIEERR